MIANPSLMFRNYTFVLYRNCMQSISERISMTDDTTCEVVYPILSDCAMGD